MSRRDLRRAAVWAVLAVVGAALAAVLVVLLDGSAGVASVAALLAVWLCGVALLLERGVVSRVDARAAARTRRSVGRTRRLMEQETSALLGVVTAELETVRVRLDAAGTDALDESGSVRPGQ